MVAAADGQTVAMDFVACLARVASGTEFAKTRVGAKRMAVVVRRRTIVVPVSNARLVMGPPGIAFRTNEGARRALSRLVVVV